MPVSHLGLTVSHIPSATSFYLAALQPLGYRYIGHQGDSIGLGVDSADFFLTQSPYGSRVSPNHIAFLADSHAVVRDCFAAAIRAGGRPNGPPSYRNDDCSCFNAAAEDLDGNTIEFIFREPHGDGCHGAAAPASEVTQVRSWRSGLHDGGESHATAPSSASKTSRAKSRAETAMELASSVSRSIRSSSEEVPRPGVTRSSTPPVARSGEISSKALIGTILGAAAGAAVAYAMVQSEEDNTKDERRYAASRASQPRSRHSVSEVPPSPTAVSSRHYPLAIGDASRALNSVEDAISRHTSYRPVPLRSQTYADSVSRSRTSRHDDGRFSVRRAITMPAGEDLDRRTVYYLEPPKSTASRRSHRPESHLSRRHSSGNYDHDADMQLKRHDSGISMRSSHHGSERSRRSATLLGSKASTLQPGSRHRHRRASDAADIALPPSTVASSTRTAARIPLPASRANDSDPWTSGADDSDGLGDMRTVVPDDSISCVDLDDVSERSRRRQQENKTASRHAGPSSSSSSSRRSEAPSERTVRAAPRAPPPSRDGRSASRRSSAMTLPVRTRRQEGASGSLGGRPHHFARHNTSSSRRSYA